MAPFTLASGSLGLLLVFRTNTAYQRWDEARKNWGKNINHTRNLNRMGNAYYDRTGVSDEQRQADLERLSLCTWAFVRSMKRHLSPESEDEASFKDYRAKELKHGRLAMMGALGMLTQSIVQVPGMEGVPKSVNAIFVGNGMVGGIAVLALIGGLEALVFVQDEQKEPGNFGNPLPWWSDYSDEMRARELNNGRIAMFAAIGQIAAGLYTGKDALEQFGL